MNDASIFIWLKSVENRLQKHGAASVRLSVDDTASPEWKISARVSSMAAWPVEAEVKAGTILELMDLGNKWVDGFDIEKEIEKYRAMANKYQNVQLATSGQMIGMGGAASSTSPYSGSGGGGIFGTGGAGQAYQTLYSQNASLQNQAYQQAYLNAFQNSPPSTQIQGTSPVTGSIAMAAAIDDAYDKMMSENVTKPTLGRKAMRVLKNLRGK